MRATVRTLLVAAASGAAASAGLWLGETLRDPTSDLRLRAGELLDRLREGVNAR